MTRTDLPQTANHDTAARSRARIRQINMLGEGVSWSIVALAARVFPAAVFWLSGRTKVEGFSVKESTFFLFEHEYALPIISPRLAAYMGTIAEHLFPILLLIGLFSRFSALALLMMTVVIQIFVYPSAWPTHGLWAACFLVVIARGPGRLSVDSLLGLEVRGRE